MSYWSRNDWIEHAKEQILKNAGRTDSYVRGLMDLYDEAAYTIEKEINALFARFAKDNNLTDAEASRLLSGVTRCAAVATTPSGDTAQVRAVQFVQTSRRTAMLILMSSTGTMKNRVFHCDFDLTSDILRVFFRVFNGKVAGKNVADITPAFLQSVGVSLGQMYVLVGAPLRALLEVAKDTMGTEVLLSGQMNLLFYPELEHGGARRVMDFLERREDVAAILRQRPGQVTILIGRELGRPELDKTSLAVSRYQVNGQDAGALAVLGPVRMDYPRVTAVLQYVSAQVSQMLTVLMRDE